MATIKALVIAGGGGGNSTSSHTFTGASGGAGGVLYDAIHSVVVGSYPITVGNGGAYDTSGQDSVFSTLTAIGGGGGTAVAGGSGSGGMSVGFSDQAGGAGTIGQGYEGGYGRRTTHGSYSGTDGGGGGGAGGAANVLNGGVGIINPIAGSTLGENLSGQYWIAGGGYNKNYGISANGYLGTGAGGSSGDSGAVGLAGAVVISFPKDGSSGVSPNSTGGTITTVGSDQIHTFTSDGTFEVKSSIAPLYWVGGSGTWDATSTTHWSATSGGAGGYDVPLATNPVIIDANSGTGTITKTDGVAASIDFTGYTGTFAGSGAINLIGNLTLGSGMTNSYTGAITLSGVNQTITNNTKIFLSALVISSTGITTIVDNMTAVSVSTTSGTLSLGAVTVTLTGTGTIWNITGGVVTAGTSTIKLNDASSTGKTFAGGGQTYNNLWLTGAGTGAFTITGSNIFADFKCDTPPHTINFTAGSITRIATFTVNGSSGKLMTLQSTSAGTPWKISKNTTGLVSCDYLSIQDSQVI